MTRVGRLVLIAALIAGGIAAYSWYKQRSGSVGDLVLQGNVEVRQVNLAFKVAGRIEHVFAEEGDTIRAGQVLAVLEKIYFEESLAQARAQLDQARANYAKLQSGNRPEEIAEARALVAEREATLTNARITRSRAESLLQTPAGSQKAFDDAAAAERQADAQLNSARQALKLQEAGFRKEDIEFAKAQVAERQAAVDTAARQLADAELIAPSDGIILSRVREAGAIVGVGDTVYVLSLNRPVWVRTYVAEPDLGRIQPGMDVSVHTDLAGGKIYSGKVGFISTTAEFTPKTVETTELRTALVYRIRVIVDGDATELRQGMPVTVTLHAPKATSVASGAP